MFLLSRIFENARSLLARYSRSLPKPQQVFIIPCTSTLFKRVLIKKHRGEETGILCRVKIKSCIFSGHDDSVKVGVNQKKILVKNRYFCAMFL